jgi:DnaA family protein
MSQQLPLNLSLQTNTQLGDYIAGDNKTLLELLQAQRETHAQDIIYLTGEPGSGRTHLLMGQCNATQALGLQVAYLPCQELLTLTPSVLDGFAQFDLLAIDDVEQLADNNNWEQALFNLFNQARDRGCRLLFSAQESAKNSGFQLADLSSRLSWGITYRLKPLDDTQREDLLINLAVRHGLDMPQEVANYLLKRETRDTKHLVALIKQLDQASLAAQRRLTLPFVRKQITL